MKKLLFTILILISFPCFSKTHRSIYERNLFLVQNGYCQTIENCHVPKGYQVDHIQPLSEGGLDLPENMQLLTIEKHKLKTNYERKLYHW